MMNPDILRALAIGVAHLKEGSETDADLAFTVETTMLTEAGMYLKNGVEWQPVSTATNGYICGDRENLYVHQYHDWNDDTGLHGVWVRSTYKEGFPDDHRRLMSGTHVYFDPGCRILIQVIP